MITLDKAGAERAFRNLDQLECWRKLLGFRVDLGQKFTSPFRPDSNGDCYLAPYRGLILFKDYTKHHMHNKTVVQAYCQLAQCTQREAISNMMVGLYPQSLAVKFTNERKVIRDPDSPCIIQYQPYTYKDQPVFTKAHLEYWAKRNITYTDLQTADNHSVLAIHSWAIDGAWVLPKTLTFAYLFDNGHIKLYEPGAPKKYRFPAGTATENDLWMWTRGSKVLIIDKSFKDGVHTSKMFPETDVMVFQGEGIFKPELVDSSYERIIIKGDNDGPGKAALKKKVVLLAEHSAEVIPFLYPETVRGKAIKDTDDMIINGFEQEAENLIKWYLL